MRYNPMMEGPMGHRANDDREGFFPGGEGFRPEMGGRRHGEGQDFGPGMGCRPGFGRGGRGMRGGFGPHCAPRDFDEGFGPRCAPRDFGEDFGPRCAPRGFGPGGPGFNGPGDPGFGGPGRPGFGGPGRPGFPPRRPNPDFLKRRIEDADLAELIEIAARMLHRRPQGGPARGQTLILSILAGRETISQRELQQMLGIQPGSLSELVSKLEAKGLLTREKAEDRRGNLLRITDAGRQASASPEPDSPEEDPFSPLDADRQDALAASLRTLLNHWVSQMVQPPQRPAPSDLTQL